MKKKHPICFLSYSHDDVDRDIVEYLMHIVRKSMKKVIILYDSDLAAGSNLKKFMDGTLNVDVAILLLTPSYKQKVDNRQGGVYREYTLITNRYWETEQEMTRDPHTAGSERFQILPVVLSGGIEQSVPETLRDLLCVNLIGFSLVKNKKGEFVVTDYIRNKYAREVNKIVDQIVATANLKSKLFAELRNRYYDDLFVNTKTSEETIRKFPEFFSDIFVPTAAFSNVQSQFSYFLIGRKGSGKSTIATALGAIEKKRYNGTISVRADNIDLKTAYHSLRASTLADLESTLPSFSFFNYSWQGFFCLCIMSLLLDLDRRNKITPVQQSFMWPIRAYVDDFIDKRQADDLTGAFFAYSIEKLQEFLDECISSARASGGESRFLADVRLSFNLLDFLHFVLGRDAVKALDSIVRNCQKRVLVTLDDFDTIFDTFRRSAKTTDDLYTRSKFETDWLRSLLLLIIDIKDRSYGDNPFFKTLDFCITIPKDRYSEIERSDRDGYRYNTRTTTILWSGIELCEVLCKRLEKLADYYPKPERRMHERLTEILASEYEELPREITFTFNRNQIAIPLFCYVLRHTFWRPRDILLYYSDLLAAAFSVSKSGTKVTEAIIRRIVSEATYHVIKTEFIDEYETTISNIRQIINQFMNNSQVLTYEQVAEALADTSFLFTTPGTTNIDLTSKIEFLYDIGFVGIVPNEQLRELLNLGGMEAFYFNEGSTPMRTAKKMHFKDVRFAIHPIFSEHLQLDYSENDFLLNLSWDYLYNNHTIKAASRNQF